MDLILEEVFKGGESLEGSANENNIILTAECYSVSL